MTAGFDLYKKYIGLKQHFNKPNYDYIKYGGTANLSADAYDKRPDQYFFETRAANLQKKEMNGYLIANFLNNKMFWIADEGTDIYNDWYIRMASLKKYIDDDLEAIREMQISRGLSIEDLLYADAGDHPKLFQLQMAGIMYNETAVVLLAGLKCYNKWDNGLNNDPIYNAEKVKIQKYARFFNVNKLIDIHKKKIVDLFRKIA